MLSAGQVNDAFFNALHRTPTGDELARYSNRSDLDGTQGQQKLIAELTGGKGQGSTTDRMISTATDIYSKAFDEYTRKYKEFDAKNPFDWNKILENERAKATQRLDPYYTQTLNDYLRGVNLKRQRSTEDERTILQELQADVDYYTGETKQKLTDAIEKSRNGYADAGLLGSGQAYRSEGQLQAAAGNNLNRYLTEAERSKQKTQLETQRFNQDLTLEEQMKKRDLAQEKSYNIESQALTGRQQALGQRQFEKGQYTGAPPGANPSVYDNSLYSFLT